MNRAVVAVTAVGLIAIGLSVTAVIAQEDPIAARQALMKGNGKNAGTIARMVKGEAEFDAAKAKEAFAGIAAGAAKFGALFPPTSKTGGDTAALPKIWDNKADFDARLVKLAADATAAGDKAVDLNAVKAAFGGVVKNCNDCHEEYRVKKN